MMEIDVERQLEHRKCMYIQPRVTVSQTLELSLPPSNSCYIDTGDFEAQSLVNEEFDDVGYHIRVRVVAVDTMGIIHHRRRI